MPFSLQAPMMGQTKSLPLSAIAQCEASTMWRIDGSAAAAAISFSMNAIVWSAIFAVET